MLTFGERLRMARERAGLSQLDVFKTIKNKGYSYNGDYRSEFNQYNDYRGFKLSLTYNFGNNKVKENNKKVNFEEQNRAN